MQIRELANGFAVTGQISADDVSQIAELGFKTLISNRPDNEMGAVPHDAIKTAAEAAGMAFHYIPVVSGHITRDNVMDMAEALKGADQPVLAYCRSGGRCTNLYGLIQSMR
jgi:uncharacterized protein (TIGR01244 family)